MTFLTVENLSLSFPLYHGESRDLRKWLRAHVQKPQAPLTGGLLTQDPRQRLSVQVLKDVSFSLRSGERLGLIGRNGAGKTSLMRALAGIYEPLSGQIRIAGRVSALLDAQFGMNPELTGAENIRLRCLFHGFSKRQSLEVLDDVRAFAELGAFLSLPVKTYSSGMALRLGFSLASAVAPQILIMDEWLLAGDANFIERARARIAHLVEKSEILVLSSHSDTILREWCTRVVWLEGGHIKRDGPAAEVLDAYAASQ